MKLLRWVLRGFDWTIRILGIVSLILIGILIVRMDRDSDDYAYLFNWGSLDPKQAHKVVWEQREPAVSMSGDYLAMTCFEIDAFAPSRPNLWKAGPEHESIYKEARLRAQQLPSTSSRPPCLKEYDSAGVKMFIWNISVHDRSIDGMTVMLFEGSTRRLFFVGFQS